MAQVLLTKEVLDNFKKYPLYSQDKVDAMEQKVIVKFFNPMGVGTWIITEASQENGDWIMFGYAELGYGYELGYVSFNELQSIKLPLGMRIERDAYLPKNCKVKDLISESELM